MFRNFFTGGAFMMDNRKMDNPNGDGSSGGGGGSAAGSRKPGQKSAAVKTKIAQYYKNKSKKNADNLKKVSDAAAANGDVPF